MLPIKQFMTKDVISIKETLPIYEALIVLTKNKVSGLPVVDDEMKVIGVLSEKDVLRLLIDKNLTEKRVVGDYMSREVISFTEEGDAMDICKFFIKSHIRRVPIVKDEKLVGIVSRRDIVNLILEAKSKISEFRYV